MHEQVTSEVIILPEGCTFEEPEWHSFAVFVRWVTHGYAVTTAFPHERLSRAGKWSHYVPKFKRRQYSWETQEEALEWAHKVVDDHKSNGRTWKEWEEHRANRNP